MQADVQTIPAIRAIKATKAYAGVPALQDVTFEVHPGEIHALLGENGAGKSTLCKVLAGVVTLTSGVIELQGQPVTFTNSGLWRPGSPWYFRKPAWFPA